MFIFRFILFLFLVYLIVTSIGRFLFGTKASIKNNEDKRNSHRQEGDITIQYNSKSKKKINKDTGEYVNYEEVRGDD